MVGEDIVTSLWLEKTSLPACPFIVQILGILWGTSDTSSCGVELHPKDNPSGLPGKFVLVFSGSYMFAAVLWLHNLAIDA